MRRQTYNYLYKLQVDRTHVPLSTSSIIWYRTRGGTRTPAAGEVTVGLVSRTLLKISPFVDRLRPWDTRAAGCTTGCRAGCKRRVTVVTNTQTMPYFVCSNSPALLAMPAMRPKSQGRLNQWGFMGTLGACPGPHDFFSF